MKYFIRRFLAGLMVCVLLAGNALALARSTNPLLGGLVAGHYTKTKDKFINILLLGIDYGYEYSDHISYKGELEDCHTDAIVVVSINKSKGTIDLISLPRDTLSYVPGVKGIYKLNAAINCADSVKEGIEKTRDTVSWHLGGIEIHHYIAVDVPALIALGDAIGGVEYDLEMSYYANSGYYQKGLQVLDGQGIMDYVRARKNATVGGTDLGRTERQRKMLSAIFQKIKANPGLLFNCLGVLFGNEGHIFTDIGFFNALSIAPSAFRVDMSTIETHVLDGKLQDFYANFNYTDQDARRELLMEVYGIEAEDTPFVSSRHTRWLINEGFEAAKVINLAQDILESTDGWFQPAEKKAARKSLEAACEKAVEAFDAAALHQGGDERDALLRARNALKAEIETAAEILEYDQSIRFKLKDIWYEDEMINEYQYNWN
ncbi:MAG: LCP family protein [Clostridia bacterium]|nr:LCP family protein [Clostridia bacterium]